MCLAHKIRQSLCEIWLFGCWLFVALCGWRRRRRLDYSGRMEGNEIVWVEPYATRQTTLSLPHTYRDRRVRVLCCWHTSCVRSSLTLYLIGRRVIMLIYWHTRALPAAAPVRHIYGESCTLYSRPIYTPPPPKDTHLDRGMVMQNRLLWMYINTHKHISSVYLRIQNPWRSVARQISLNFPFIQPFSGRIILTFLYFPGVFV